MNRFMQQVRDELGEMVASGMSVPVEAIRMCENEAIMAGYRTMGISECADLLVQLARSEDPKEVEGLDAFARILIVLDSLEELGGPDPEEYVALMDKVIQEALRRRDRALAIVQDRR